MGHDDILDIEGYLETAPPRINSKPEEVQCLRKPLSFC
jgi:hypothetical protein